MQSPGATRTEARIAAAAAGRPARDEDVPAHGVVVIVGHSRINAIVVSKIVERCGLRHVWEAPEKAIATLQREGAQIVILDGGPGDADCRALIPPLAELRATTRRSAPAVILLSTANFPDLPPSYDSVVDAVVAKPILPEHLQPVVERLAAATRG
jgi:CheY-like chemotaxis protein